MNIIEELYYGNVVPNEKHAKLSDELKELLKLLTRNEDKFLKHFQMNRKSSLKSSRTVIVKFLKSANGKLSCVAFS